MLDESKSIGERVLMLEKFLYSLETSVKPPTDIKVYHYNAEGFRIAEISYVWRNPTSCSGASYMRSQPECAAVILAAEEFVIFLNDIDMQFHEEAKDNLRYLLQTK